MDGKKLVKIKSLYYTVLQEEDGTFYFTIFEATKNKVKMNTVPFLQLKSSIHLRLFSIQETEKSTISR